MTLRLPQRIFAIAWERSGINTANNCFAFIIHVAKLNRPESRNRAARDNFGNLRGWCFDNRRCWLHVFNWRHYSILTHWIPLFEIGADARTRTWTSPLPRD